ncbi:MAG: MFS transporter [Xanthobacteraceae bacterium]|nr:MFS transporter [Xanthobacteraceae bacterium]MBY0613012.1 MFS transporter [Beijerinckiaceae bacterium]
MMKPINLIWSSAANVERATLAAVVATAITLPFGQAVTGVQLGAIAAGLGNSLSEVEWVANGYNLTFSAFLLIAGALGDRYGRRRVFIAGTLTFLAGSLASAFAPNLTALVLCRLLAGTGAAVQLASAPALLAAVFPEPGPSRARAFGLLGTGFGIGLAIGPLVGGWLVASLGWRAAFAIVVPFALAGLIAALAIPDSRAETAKPFDVVGSVVFALTLLGFMLALALGPERGWTDGMTLGLVAASIFGLVVWTYIERFSSAPMIDLTMFSDHAFLGASVAWWAAAFGFVSLLIYVPVYLDHVRHASAFAAGLALLPMTLPLLAVPSLAPWLVARFGLVRVVGCGVLLIAVGDVVLPLSLLAGLGLVGIGAGAINGLLDNIAMSTIPSDRAGMAAGGFQTMRVAGDAMAIAVAGSLLAALSGNASTADANAFQNLFAILAAITAVGAVIAIWLLRSSTSDANQERTRT